VQSGLPLDEAENLCVTKIAELTKPAASLSPGLKPGLRAVPPRCPAARAQILNPAPFLLPLPAVLSR
jgi:hypothetical protein